MTRRQVRHWPSCSCEQGLVHMSRALDGDTPPNTRRLDSKIHRIVSSYLQHFLALGTLLIPGHLLDPVPMSYCRSRSLQTQRNKPHGRYKR